MSIDMNLLTGLKNTYIYIYIYIFIYIYYAGQYMYIYIYIYIYCHAWTNSFLVSQLFIEARHARCFKLRSKTGWLFADWIYFVELPSIWEKAKNFFRTHIYIYHHHHIVLAARISLTLSRHSSLSFIALGRSSGQQPVSSHSCWMYVRAGRPAFARPCVGIHKSTSLMSSSLLLQQCPACLVRLTWIVFVIGGRWPYSWCLVGC